jgi:hypothetical protein
MGIVDAAEIKASAAALNARLQTRKPLYDARAAFLPWAGLAESLMHRPLPWGAFWGSFKKAHSTLS